MQGLPPAQAREPQARQAARARHRLLPRSHRAADQGDGRHPLRADGTVTIITGTLDYGQGHATPFAQVLSEKLGIPFERIRLLQGDSDELLAGGGTGGSQVDDDERHRDRRSLRQGDRAGQADRLARAGSVGRRHRVQATAASPSPAPTARSASWSSPQKLRVRPQAAGRRAAVARRQARQRRRAPPPIPNGCHVCRGRDRSRHRRDRGGEIHLRSTTSAPSSIRCWSTARCTAAWCRASARR